MAGQLIKRGKATWLVRIPLGRDVDGKRIYHNHTVKGIKKDAERYRTQKLRELDTETFVEASRQTVGLYLREWLRETVSPRVRTRTLADYQALAERHLIPAIGHRSIAQLTPAEIQKVYAEMQARGLSPRTIRYAHSVLHNALEQAVRWRLLARNPAHLVTLPRRVRREMRSLSADEAGQLLSASAGTRFEALWALLLSTGLRPGEALALRWSDFSGERIHVQRSLTWTKGRGPEMVDPKTAKARRVVSVPLSVGRLLQRHRVEQVSERLKAGTEWRDLDLVFSSIRGEPLEWRVVSRRYFQPLRRAANLHGLRPYDLRHSCASLLLAAGENVKVVSERLGHASAALTLDVYSHVLPHMQQSAADRMEALLFTRLPAQ